MYKDGFKPIISIIVPVYNQADKTIKCFASIRASTETPHEVIWVDNGSNDKEYKKIRWQATRPRVRCKVVKNKMNLGFVKATNQGIKEAEGDYIILLNNDTEVYMGWEKRLINPLIEDKSVGAVGPVTQSRIAWQEATALNRRWSLKVPLFKNDPVEYSKLLYKTFGNRYIDVGILPLSFFCCAFRRSIFDEVGKLDENFGIGLGDDDDFCCRLRYYNYKLALALGTFVYHYHRTTFKATQLNIYALRRKNVKIIKKNELAYKALNNKV